MIGIVIAIIWFIAVLYLDVQSDYKRIQTNSIKHGRGLAVRTAALFPSFGCLLFPLDNIQWWYIALKSFVVAGMLGAWWWEFFDGWLNTKRGYSWRYNGSDDEGDAKTDNFLQKYTPVQQMWIKWSLITIFTITYFLL